MMHRPHHLLKLVIPRAQSCLNRLQGLVWEPDSSVEIFKVYEGEFAVPYAEVSGQSGESLQCPHHWGRMFDYAWFRLEIPKDKHDGDIYLNWREQGEATLFLDGEPYFGFDVAHQQVKLPDSFETAWVESICCQSAIWHPAAKGLDAAGSRIDGASLQRRNELAWLAYHDLVVLIELLLQEIGVYNQSEETPKAVQHLLPDQFRLPAQDRQMLRAIEEAMDCWDADGLEAFVEALADVYKKFPASSTDIRCTLTGHAHIDLVWMWPEKTGETKAVHSFATADYLMERYPEFRFGYSQPASYEAVERKSPELMNRVRKRIAERKWDATGALYVESDNILACGETLARSFLLGQEWFKKETGAYAETVWLPDVFGYTGCLPQLMRLAGAKYFYTNKLNWRSVTEFPYSSFKWVGYDGSEVFAHIPKGTFNFYNSEILAKDIRDNALLHQQADIHPEVLVAAGYGDGGGGPTEEMCERARRMQNLWGVPKTSWDNIDSFFNRMEAVMDNYPKWHGEFLIQHHRGVYTTHCWLKAAFRRLEKSLQEWESVRCVTGGGSIPQHYWERLVFATFHDYIPGSSVHEVYREAKEELDRLADEADQSAKDELAKFSQGEAACLYNPLAETLRIDGGTIGQDESVFEIPALTGIDVCELTPVNGLKPVEVTSNSLSNGIVQVAFSKEGQIESFEVSGENIRMSEPLGQLVIHPDYPHAFDAWDIDRHSFSSAKSAQFVEAVVSDNRLTFRYCIGEKSTIDAIYKLEAGADTLRITYEIDWHERDHLLKAYFPTSYMGERAMYGAPFGAVRRKQRKSTLDDQADWEVPGSRYAVVCDEGEREGLMMVTKDRYGFSCDDGNLGLTLLRSVKTVEADIDPQTLEVKQGLKRYVPAEGYTDIGSHTVELAIGLFNGASQREHLPAMMADKLFTDPVPYKGQAIESVFSGLDGGESLRVSWLKPEPDGAWTLRLEETLGRHGSATLKLTKNCLIDKTDFLGQILEKNVGTNLSFAPYEIISLRLATT